MDTNKLAYDFVEEHFAESINHSVIGAALRELLRQVYLGRQDIQENINLYIITQDANTGCDTCNSMVVAAKSEAEAGKITPVDGDSSWCWTSPENVKVCFLGKATNDIGAGVICASFHAG